MTDPSALHPACQLLAAQMARREWDVVKLARALAEPPGRVREQLAGERPLTLDWLERALVALGAAPREFFAELYAGPASSTNDDREVPSRQEVEATLSEVRSLLRGTARMAEAERKLGS